MDIFCYGTVNCIYKSKSKEKIIEMRRKLFDLCHYSWGQRALTAFRRYYLLKEQTQWSNNKTIIELGYRKISWFYPANFIHVHIVIFEMLNLSPTIQITEMSYISITGKLRSCWYQKLATSSSKHFGELARRLWYQH